MIELGPDDFRTAGLAQRREQALQRRRTALLALHDAQHALTEHAARPDAAARDGERLEAVAHRLIGFSHGLEQDLRRLEVARDRQAYRGPVRTLQPPPLDASTLAMALADSLAETQLSGPAGAVLQAAVRHAAS